VFGGSPSSLRLGGVPGTSSQGRIDDFAVWNRVLSYKEIAELYAAAGSLGTSCQL
jgi:hypothetical protein